MAKTLTTIEIKQRLVKLRNYEHSLYPAARARIGKLVAENAQLKTENLALKTRVIDLESLIQKLQFQVEQLNAKVFGRKNQGRGGSGSSSVLPPKTPEPPKPPRNASSYRRTVPDQADITATAHHAIDPHQQTDASGKPIDHTGHVLSCHKTIDYFEEDVVLPSSVSLKTVTKHSVEAAYCGDCNLWLYGKQIPKQSVIIGNNVRALISFHSVVSRFSYQQIIDHLQAFYNLRISSGEIARVLEGQANKLRPAYNQLIVSILQQSGVHFDESTWKMLIEKLGHYVWVMTGTDNRDAAFFFGQSRGKGVLDKMLASLKQSGKQIIGISDDYGAYRCVAAFLAHALCWAHPNRKLRDLAQSKTLKGLAAANCLKTYRQFNELYQAVNSLWAKADITPLQRTAQRRKLIKRFKVIAKPAAHDPPELLTLKASLRSNQAAYFVCLRYPGVPPDNNKAERALRHVVLKRKACFGSKTQAGADALSVLYSILLSLWWRQPQDFFGEYQRLLEIPG